ncbi:MAG: Gfo/Idh/MocA family oxidoreductase [Clostridiales bacterium]|nr:Gfo/Idh/MocA family oxidoreductase [Clostridiales bacterium]
MDKVRVGIIGCGGRSYAHVNKLVDFEDVEIVAVADPIEERRLKMAEKTDAKRIYKDHKELYDNEATDAIDVVYISVEPTAHDGIEEGAIEKGWHFAVEKPMTLDIDQAENIAKEARDKKIITWVGFQDRYLDIVDALREELPKHKTGLVYGSWIGGIPMLWWWLKKSTCGGQLVEQNIHLLDMLRYLYGEPKSVYATASTGIVEGVEGYDTDDHSTAVIRFKNSVTATLVSGCYLTKENPGSHNGLLITCDDMIIDYKLRDSVTFSTRSEVRKLKTTQDHHYVANRTFIDAVKSKDASKVRSPYEDALKTLKLGFAANESMETGQVITL